MRKSPVKDRERLLDIEYVEEEPKSLEKEVTNSFPQEELNSFSELCKLVRDNTPKIDAKVEIQKFLEKNDFKTQSHSFKYYFVRESDSEVDYFFPREFIDVKKPGTYTLSIPKEDQKSFEKILKKQLRKNYTCFNQKNWKQQIEAYIFGPGMFGFTGYFAFDMYFSGEESTGVLLGLLSSLFGWATYFSMSALVDRKNYKKTTAKVEDELNDKYVIKSSDKPYDFDLIKPLLEK